MKSFFFPRLIGASAFLLALTACSGLDAVSNHGQLDVHTHMSETVFLDPVPQNQKTVYLGIRNTSDYPELDIRSALASALQQRGYTIMPDAMGAHYLLQANVLQAGKLTKEQSSALLSSNYGQPLQSLAIGAASGGLVGGLTGNAGAGLGVGLGLAAASALVNYAYQDVTYAITVDIQLSERPANGGKVRQHTHTHHGSGSSRLSGGVTDSTAQTYGAASSGDSNANVRVQDIDETSDFKKYTLRDVAYADKVNLKLGEAMPVLTQRLAVSFANLFE
ncbi:complement resistance protein TraT [Asaia bogorensis]|uniref:Conjugative transfer: surface exclusion n=1 Tax=Asaia bogorensis NBRC 16594 TaxID=1231624 RepID=A0AAN4R499_9PROT|nr:complement resistance protein TraT [Asaia bogorensis]GBQ81360.1 conjugal transfer surface exclusion protein TraT [Asaia bogorensis NBRC 16594]GEL54888.1 conjugative transfer: surface exclusion [Asaia bogorensis NBRC 16594]